MEKYHDKIVNGMTERGYDEAFAKSIFEQINGFSKYGFPERHAASFALLVYVSCWIKCHHPTDFIAAAVLEAGLMSSIADKLLSWEGGGENNAN